MATKPKLPKGVNLERSLEGFKSKCYALAWSPDGSQLAAGFGDGTIRVWSADTWAEPPRPMAGHRLDVISVAWSPDGRRLASGSRDGSVGVWDIEAGKRLHSYKGDRDVWSVVWSPNGRHIMWGDQSRNVNIRDTSGADEEVALEGHSNDVNTLAFSPNGSQLASGSDDRTVRLWNLKSRKTVRSFKGRGVIWNVAWSPDGALLASTELPTIRIWDAASGKQLASLEGHSTTVQDAFFSPDGRLFASGAEHRDIRLWRCDTWACSATIAHRFVGGINTAMAWHPEAPLLAASCEEGMAIYLLRIDPSLGA